MRLTKISALVLCVLTLLSLIACNTQPDPTLQETDRQTTLAETSTSFQTEADTEAVTEATTEIKSEPETEPESESTTEEVTPPDTVPDAIAIKKQQLEEIKQSIGAKSDTVLYAKDFGAVGDGSTDDGAAIFEAVTQAVLQHATLKFEQDKTYYIGSVPGNRLTPFNLTGAEDVTIDGCNATFLVAPSMHYVSINNSSNVKIINCHFDYAVPIYLVGKAISVSGTQIVFSTDIEPYRNQYDYARTGFSIAYNEGLQERPHIFLSNMTRTGEKQVTVDYPTGHTYREGQLVFLPNPGVGHIGNAVCTISDNNGPLLFENIGIHAAPVFCWNISKSQGKVFFENVDLVPAPNNDRQLKLVSWRDGFHCKDNPASLHWNNCDAAVLFDDVFNIANTLGEVLEIEGDNVFTVRNYEYYGNAFFCNPGDTIDIFDVRNGDYKGNARVRSIRNNADGSRTLTLYYGQTIQDVTAGCMVANRDTGAPGSTITNCHFEGTFRFNRSLYVENTTFDMLQTWIMVSGNVEGPLPGNMDFVNCTFNHGNIQIDAQNYETSKRMNKIGKQITDIGYWGCTFNKSSIRTSTMTNFTQADTFVTDDLYTVKNAAINNDPIFISPTDQDVAQGVTWDWSLFTMPMTGDIAEIKSIDSLTLPTQNVQGVGKSVLALNAITGEKLYFDGLSASAIPCLYKKDTAYFVKLTYYAATPTKAKLVIGGQVLDENLFETVGEWTTVTMIYQAASDEQFAYIACESEGKVYLGELTLATFVNANPSISQLETGHTFAWDGKVKIAGGDAVALGQVENEAAKQAMLAHPDKFGATVLHLDGNVGDFNGLTKKNYFTPGTTYRISIDAYIASPISSDSAMHLMVLDNNPGNRMLAEGIFQGEGLYHFEIEWKVGNTGESKLKFFIPNIPTAYADIYVGNFTITKLPGLAPYQTIVVQDFAQPTIEELKAGFTFDFSKGIFLDTGKQSYVDTSCLNDYAAQTLANAGFGEYAYYYNETCDAVGLAQMIEQYAGNRFMFSFKVYDCQGNLTTAPEGALILLNMTDDKQNSAGCAYMLSPDSEIPGLYDMIFIEVPPQGTDTLRFYVLEPCEFYIASITVKIG